MKQLTNVSTKMLVLMLWILTSSILLLWYILSYNIESTMKVKLMPSLSENVVYIDQNDVFKLSIDDNLTLKLKDKYYVVSIKNIKGDLENKRYALTLNERLPFQGENISIPAIAIYNEQSVAQMLFGNI